MLSNRRKIPPKIMVARITKEPRSKSNPLAMFLRFISAEQDAAIRYISPTTGKTEIKPLQKTELILTLLPCCIYAPILTVHCCYRTVISTSAKTVFSLLATRSMVVPDALPVTISTSPLCEHDSTVLSFMYNASI